MKTLPLPPDESQRRLAEYDDPIEYLKDFLFFQKENDNSFSLNKFSKSCGFGSKSFIQFLLKRERSLTSQSAVRLARGMKLTRSDTALFFAMIRFHQEKDSLKKEKHRARLTELRRLNATKELQRDKLEYVRDWYLPVIRELSNLPHFRADPKWIASTLFPAIDVSQAERALLTLENLGFLKRLPNGSLRPSEPIVNIAEEMGASEIFSFFLQSIELSKAALLNLPSSQREFGHLTLSLGKDEFDNLKAELCEFRQKIFEKYGDGKISDSAVYQFNLQFFPVTKKN